jgi:hypothetical protein
VATGATEDEAARRFAAGSAAEGHSGQAPNLIKPPYASAAAALEEPESDELDESDDFESDDFESDEPESEDDDVSPAVSFAPLREPFP